MGIRQWLLNHVLWQAHIFSCSKCMEACADDNPCFRQLLLSQLEEVMQPVHLVLRYSSSPLLPAVLPTLLLLLWDVRCCLALLSGVGCCCQP